MLIVFFLHERSNIIKIHLAFLIFPLALSRMVRSTTDKNHKRIAYEYVESDVKDKINFHFSPLNRLIYFRNLLVVW